jgi:transcriptional regulator with XRE-family HTH domain
MSAFKKNLFILAFFRIFALVSYKHIKFHTENYQYPIGNYNKVKSLQGWVMTSLKKLLAFNMKEQRRILGISQATLAERISTSTNYIAMIELERKTPSIQMLERIAVALHIDAPELFSQKNAPSAALRKLQKTVLEDIEKAVSDVISERLNEVESNEDYQNEVIKT